MKFEHLIHLCAEKSVNEKIRKFPGQVWGQKFSSHIKSLKEICSFHNLKFKEHISFFAYPTRDHRWFIGVVFCSDKLMKKQEFERRCNLPKGTVVQDQNGFYGLVGDHAKNPCRVPVCYARDVLAEKEVLTGEEFTVLYLPDVCDI